MDKTDKTTEQTQQDVKTRRINVTIEIEDNDWIEGQLEETLNKFIGRDSITNYKVLPDTTELYQNDQTFRELHMKKKAATRIYNDYINKTKIK